MNIFSTKISNTWIVTILALVIIASCFLIYKNFSNENTKNSTVIPATTPVGNSEEKNSPIQTETKNVKINSNEEFGFWVWGSPQYLTEAQVKNLATKIKSYGGTSLYITIDDYLSIQNENSSLREKDEKDFEDGLDRFIKVANGEGIVVDAESGDRDWVNPENRAEAWTLINFLKKYNDTHANKFRNFQYDVEPYLMPEYDNNKAMVLLNYLSFIDETLTNMKGMSMGFSVVIPYFYDAAQKFTPVITYDGETKYPYSILLDILDKRPGSSIIIMAYRNFATGDNGAVTISEPEVDEASNGIHKTKIIIAQETGKVDPSYTTFYGKSKKDLFDQISSINDFFKNKSSFAGVAVDYVDPFFKLSD